MVNALVQNLVNGLEHGSRDLAAQVLPVLVEVRCLTFLCSANAQPVLIWGVSSFSVLYVLLVGHVRTPLSIPHPSRPAQSPKRCPAKPQCKCSCLVQNT